MNNIIQECITKRRVVEQLLNFPNREFTINELSKISDVPYATTWRFVQKIDKAGVVLCKRIGHSQSCRLNTESPLVEEVRKAMEIKSSPQQAVLDLFVSKAKKIKEIEEIILFGSVASGRERLTSDVDIALLTKSSGSKIKSTVTEIVDSIAVKSKVIIVPLFLTYTELDEKKHENKQFIGELRKGKVLYVRHKRDRVLAEKFLNSAKEALQ